MTILLFNMGLPMIIPAMYLMVLGLIPIVLLESIVISKKLVVSYFTVLKSVSLGNIISTVVGIPVTWSLLLFIEITFGSYIADLVPNFHLNEFWQNLFTGIVFAAWIPPTGKDNAWLIFAALGFLLIPFFVASWFLEYLLMKARLANQLYDSRVNAEERAEYAETLSQITKDGYLPEIRTAVRNANLLSYGLLELFVLILFLSTRPLNY